MENTDLIAKYVEQRGDDWVVLSESGKVLGRHKTRKEALEQLRAIEANKELFKKAMELGFINVEEKSSPKMIKIWAPFTKAADGDIQAILSDTSIDRENERMSKELIERWAENVKAIPALANHKRDDFEKIVAVWTDAQLLKNGDHRALQMKPNFLSHPYAQMVKQIVSECIQHGYNPGTSIGAIPKNHRDLDENGLSIREYTEADLVEASFTPIQANPNAMTFMGIAKSFDTEKIDCGDTISEKQIMEGDNMEKDKHEELEKRISELEAQLQQKDKELEELKKQAKPAEPEPEPASKPDADEASEDEGVEKQEKPSKDKKEEDMSEEEKKKKKQEMEGKSMEEVEQLQKKVAELEKKLEEPVLKGQANEPSEKSSKSFTARMLGKAYGGVNK